MSMAIKLLLLLIACCIVVYAVVAILQTRSFEVRKISYKSEKFVEQLDGYRIAFVADPHLDQGMDTVQIQNVVERLNAEDIDLLLLGGDYGSNFEECFALLAGIKTADGIYAVLGNHDYDADTEPLLNAADKAGIRFLNNDGTRVRDNLFIAGIEDMQEGTYDLSKAVGKAAGNDFVLLLSHNPDIIEVMDSSSADLVLSGHTHGGQITFFGFFAPLTSSKYGYWHGFYTKEGKPDLLVSNGLGTVYLHIRAFAMPQVYILTLDAA